MSLLFWIFQKIRRLFLYLVLCLLTASMSFLIAESLVLNQYATSKKDTISSEVIGLQRYTIVDNLLEDKDFHQFRHNQQNVNSVIDFYNRLADSKVINLLSVFDQPLYIENFQGKQEFLYGSQDFQESNQGYPTAVNALQLNKNAFEFYHLSLEEHQTVDWQDIDYENDKPIPLILGHNYRTFYKIGDRLRSDLYSKDKTFQVIGFLPQNSFIYYNNEPEFYLDNYMIVPYPLHLSPVKTDDMRFESILSFAMINSDFVSQASQQEVIDEIKSISNSSGFSQFSLINLDNTFLKYDALLNIISHNQALLFLTIGGLSVVYGIILYTMLLALLRLKLPYYQVSWLLGYPTYLREAKYLTFGLLILSVLVSIIPFVQFTTLPSLLSASFFLLNLALFFLLYKLLIKRMSIIIGGTAYD